MVQCINQFLQLCFEYALEHFSKGTACQKRRKDFIYPMNIIRQTPINTYLISVHLTLIFAV